MSLSKKYQLDDYKRLALWSLDYQIINFICKKCHICTHDSHIRQHNNLKPHIKISKILNKTDRSQRLKALPENAWTSKYLFFFIFYFLLKMALFIYDSHQQLKNLKTIKKKKTPQKK